MRICLMILAAVWLGVSSMARASAMYDYVAEQDATTVNLYLREVSAPASFTALSDGGLYSGGVAFVEEPGGTGVSVAFNGVSNNTAPTPAGFTDALGGSNFNGLVTGGGAWLFDSLTPVATVGVAPASSTTSGGTTTSLYLLGSVSMNINSHPNATFIVESLHDLPPGKAAVASEDSTFTFDTNYDLDGIGSGTAPGVVGADGNPTYFTFGPGASVPEPGTVAVFGIGAIGLLARRRRAR